MTVSHWRRTERLGTTECEALVVGAGICGIAAALELERCGLRAVVVERCWVGAGASGRNAGFLMRGLAESYAAAVEAYGREAAKRVFRMSEENLAALRREGIETLPSYRAIPSCVLAMKEEEAAVLRRSVSMMREDGFAVEWVKSGEDTVWRSGRVLGGLVNPGDGSVNPVDMLGLLASKLREPVRERQEVVEIRPEGEAVFVRTTDGAYRAGRVLVCTNAYAGLLLPELAKLVTPRRGQMLALRKDGARLDSSYYANFGSEYFRQTPDGTIVFGGCRTYNADEEVGYEDRTTPKVQSMIERYADELIGPGYEITARWSGTMGFSPDGMPMIGQVLGDRVWFCGGFTGHGMSLGFRTAQAAVDAMLGGSVDGELSRVLSIGRFGA